MLSKSQPIEKRLRTRRLWVRRGWGNIFLPWIKQDKRNFLGIHINVGGKWWTMLLMLSINLRSLRFQCMRLLWYPIKNYFVNDEQKNPSSLIVLFNKTHLFEWCKIWKWKSKVHCTQKLFPITDCNHFEDWNFSEQGIAALHCTRIKPYAEYSTLGRYTYVKIPSHNT